MKRQRSPVMENHIAHGLMCILLCGLLAGSAAAQEMFPTAVNPGTVLNPADHGQVLSERPIMFRGSTMTTDRARGIAGRAGYELISFLPCTENLQECAILEVIGPAGRVYQYQITSEDCWTAEIGGHNTANLGNEIIQIPPRQKRRLANPGSSTTINNPVSFGGVTNDDKDPWTNGCFAGYKVAFRARQLDTLWVAAEGRTISLEQVYQTFSDNRWVPLATVKASSWYYGDVFSGATSGWAYELRDSSGTLLTSDSDSVFSIASGGSTEVSATDLCNSRRDSIVADQQFVVALLYAAADILTILDQATIEVSLEPFGFGGSVTVSKTVDIPEHVKEIGDAHATKAGTDFHTDCLQHPGKYFPAKFPPEPGELSLAEQATFESPFGETNLATAANCPSTLTGQEAADMGGGTVCTATVRRTCEITTEGECVCNNPVVVDEYVCTSAP